MNILTKLLFSVLFFLLCATNLVAQDDDSVDTSDEKNGEFISPASLGDTALNRNNFETDNSVLAYKEDKDFAYLKYLDSLLKKTKGLTVDTFSSNNTGSFKRKNDSSQNAESARARKPSNIFSNPIVKVILWVMAIFLIGFLIYKLFLGENFFRRNRAYQKTSATQKEGDMITDPSAYDKMISQAVMNKNYRLAIRYLYLQALQNLSGKGALQFSTDKTNTEYITELRGKPYQNDFAAITLSYEYVWYGKFDISEDTYNRLLREYNSLQQKL